VVYKIKGENNMKKKSSGSIKKSKNTIEQNPDQNKEVHKESLGPNTKRKR
jgi:hypothetical protein